MSTFANCLLSCMNSTIVINADAINSLDLSPAKLVISEMIAEKMTELEANLQFKIDYPRDATDPRELSEIPEIRLWFIRLDVTYPWLPLFLDWKAGELARYTAMLVPHQFHRAEGIQYNPEALEIFVMHKVFVIADWLKQQGIPGQSRLKSMTQMFGYEIDEDFWQMIT